MLGDSKDSVSRRQFLAATVAAGGAAALAAGQPMDEHDPTATEAAKPGEAILRGGASPHEDRRATYTYARPVVAVGQAMRRGRRGRRVVRSNGNR
ncbi:MAG: twin-arginine translocation signal domain-containing protein [Pirellulaceae bacterium]